MVKTPKVTLDVSEHEMKLLRRLARHEHRSEARTAATLMHMTMRMIQREERVGIYYGPTPRSPRPLGSQRSRVKDGGRCAGWTREERDTWILTGEEPVHV
jgi:hypothetical protein